MPSPSYHADVLRPLEDFIEGSIRTVKQVSDGKPIMVLLGKLKDGGKQEAHSIHFPVSDWTAAEAKKKSKGTFEAATAGSTGKDAGATGRGLRFFAMDTQADAGVMPPATGGEQWVLLIPRGEWGWKDKRRLTFDDVALEEFRANFERKVLHTQPYFNLDHPNDTTEAAGWIEEVRVSAHGLEGRVEWTPIGAKALADGTYRYVSPEWYPTFTDPETRKQYHNVLAGAALTNDPFFRRPMAEHSLLAASNGVIMFADNADEEGAPMPKPKPNPTPEDDPTLDPDDEGSDLETGEGEHEEADEGARAPKRKPAKRAGASSEGERLKAAERRNRELAERLDAAEKQTAAQQARLDRKEIEEKLAAMRLGAGRDLALTPAARALFADLAMASDDEEVLFASAQAKDGKADQTARDRVLTLAASAADLTYPLGVKGFVAGEDPSYSSAMAEVDRRADEKMKAAGRDDRGEPKLSYPEAVREVIAADAELAGRYTRESSKSEKAA